MAYIKPKRLVWGASPDSDVTHYVVRWAVPPEVIEYNPTINPGVNVGLVSEVSLPMSGMPGIDGQLTIGIVAVDDAGNESEAAEGTFPFDFIPPAPPTSIAVL